MTESEREVIEEVVTELKELPCTFWACDGWAAPFVPMKTCRVCYVTQQLIKLLEAKE